MSNEPATSVSSQGISLDPPDKKAAERQEIRRLAQEFEALLMTQMLREMRRSMLDDQEQEENGFGAGALTDTADIEFGRALSRSGGVGLSDALLRAFERQLAPQTGSELPAAEASPAPTGSNSVSQAAVSGPVLTEVTAAAPISSQFGWRQDPLSGTPRFHQGVDIAVAYGRDVKAAAEGTVAFAGVQNGYGNTVVIDHEGGRQTRYAHLSAELVQAGDRVAEGQIVGKSGNSGRSTGPHLHFEMLVNGRPVDPAVAGGDGIDGTTKELQSSVDY